MVDYQIFIIFVTNRNSWYNWLSNDDSSFHLTQRVFLHYLGKSKHMK